MQTFNSTSPRGCYDDIEKDRRRRGPGARTWAEMHPTSGRASSTRASRALSTGSSTSRRNTTPTSAGADTEIVSIKPNRDSRSGTTCPRSRTPAAPWTNDFRRETTASFARGDGSTIRASGCARRGSRASRPRRHARPASAPSLLTEGIGDRPAGLDPVRHAHPPPEDAEKRFCTGLITFEDFQEGRRAYTLDFGSPRSRKATRTEGARGSTRGKLKSRRRLTPTRRGRSSRTGRLASNQHTRGTWVNEQAYMAHLLTGKTGETGQRRVLAHGPAVRVRTAREVGTLLAPPARPT